MCPCLFMLQGFASAKQMYSPPHASLLETPHVPFLGRAGCLVRALLAVLVLSAEPANTMPGCLQATAQLREGTRT